MFTSRIARFALGAGAALLTAVAINGVPGAQAQGQGRGSSVAPNPVTGQGYRFIAPVEAGA